jgi:cobalt-zinc-cadmium resistance protein CzcA
MIEKLIHLSVKNKLVVGLLTLGLIIGGIFSLSKLPIDAVPDITNNQVQVVTVANSLAPQEVEQFITYPIEVSVSNIPNVTEIRSISRYGLSVITIVFEDRVPILEARQFVKEQLSLAAEEIPSGMGSPELMPITTGLGEIYQYVLEVDPAFADKYDAMELRTIQDWIVKRQLAGMKGIIEISSFGGYLKQYEVALDPRKLRNLDISLSEVYDALAANNQNSGGSYIEKTTNAYYIRTEGIIKDFDDIEQIQVGLKNNTPVLVKDIGKVQLGAPKRFGAMTMDGKGEVVGGITLMYKGANSSEAIQNVHDRIEIVKKSLPEGVHIYPYLDRSVLVAKTISTVKKNLLEGGLIVILVLVILLGDLRAGLIVASVIPLAMLFALILMNYFGVSANLMSLGAIDFGIVVDGAVIVVEGVLHAIFTYHVGKTFTQSQMDEMVTEASAKLFRAAVFGVFIILVVFIPIMTLTGIEGKMFRPMAMTFSFAVLGALLLSLTYVPAVTALVMPKTIKAKRSLADRIMEFLRGAYKPSLEFALKKPVLILGSAGALLIGSILLFNTMGSVFIPTLEEGDLAMQMAIQPGSSLEESVKTATKAEKVLLENFPEIKHVVSKIGTAEVPTDPMAIEDADIMIILKERDEWVSADSREELVEKMKEKLEVIVGAGFEFTQPIQLRFNELTTGAKTDIAVKIFGEDTEELKRLADQAEGIIKEIQGAGDVKAEQTEGLPQLMIKYNRQKIAEYGLDIESLNEIIRASFAGEKAGVVFENERKFDLVVRLQKDDRQDLALGAMFIKNTMGQSVPLSELAKVEYSEGPMQISREGARRRINIGVNVRNRDIASLVEEIQQKLETQMNLPPGYYFTFGGQFENLQQATKRLMIAVPIALLLIFALLYFTFEKIKYALLIFSAVPLSAIGGVFALWLRDMPFSISAGVGFIALFGVAVLNGIVLISHFNRMRYDENESDIYIVVIEGSLVRLRPVIMTATVAALGFLPMALSTTNGAEVQRPLATVVIGGLITATLLTLLVLPVFYYLVNKNINRTGMQTKTLLMVIGLGGLMGSLNAQNPFSPEAAMNSAVQNHPAVDLADLKVQQAKVALGGAKIIPATDFSLQGGQINTSAFDYNVSVQQSLGNFSANKARKSLLENKIDLSEAEKEQMIYHLKGQALKSYVDWYFKDKKSELFNTQLDSLNRMLELADIQFNAGEIDRMDISLIRNEINHVRQLQIIAESERLSAYYQLKAATFSQDSLLAPDTLMLPMLDSNTVREAILGPYKKMVEVSQQEIDLANASKKPEFNVGYFNQSIRPDYSFQGVMVGASIPIFQKAIKSKIEEARVGEMIQHQNLLATEKLLEYQVNRANQVEKMQAAEWQTSGKDLLIEAASLLELAKLKLNAGETNYLDFIQTWRIAWNSRMTALEAESNFRMSQVNRFFPFN